MAGRKLCIYDAKTITVYLRHLLFVCLPLDIDPDVSQKLVIISVIDCSLKWASPDKHWPSLSLWHVAASCSDWTDFYHHIAKVSKSSTESNQYLTLWNHYMWHKGSCQVLWPVVQAQQVRMDYWFVRLHSSWTCVDQQCRSQVRVRERQGICTVSVRHVMVSRLRDWWF